MNINKKKFKPFTKELFCPFILIILLAAIKFYFLFMKGASVGSYGIALNTMLYFNAKSIFYGSLQSFNDWNHPGTPVYFLGYLIGLSINGLDINKLNLFININHFLSFAFLSYSIIYFYKKNTKLIDKKIITIFFLLTLSFDPLFLTLESIDLLNYLVPAIIFQISLMIGIYKSKLIGEHDLIKLSIINALLLSIKLSSLPLVFCSFLIVFLKLINEKQYLKVFKKIFYLFSFFLIFNFPIIGRIPKIIYNILFVRDDTKINFNDFSSLSDLYEKFLSFFNAEDYILFILIFCLIFFSLSSLINKYAKKTILNVFDFYSILLILFFFYTIIVTFQHTDIDTIRGVLTRNSFFYLSFIFFHKILCDKENYRYTKNIFLIFSVFCFIVKSIFYISNRNDFLTNIDIKEKELKKIMSKYITEESKIGIFNLGNYGFKDFSALSIANDDFSSERFTHEIHVQFKNLRYLRLTNIQNNLLEINDSRLNKLFINKHYEELDNFLGRNFPKNIYLILTHKSYKISNVNFYELKKKNDLFLKEYKEEKLDLILIRDNKNYDINILQKYIAKETKFKSIEFFIDKDKWLLFKPTSN